MILKFGYTFETEMTIGCQKNRFGHLVTIRIWHLDREICLPTRAFSKL